jgi:hypothetical protein
MADPAHQKGFWKLHHLDLRAILRTSGLSWEAVRVFLALGDLTLGRGKAEAAISNGDLARFGGMHREHVPRAIERLRGLGLYDEKRVSDRRVVRWIVWPTESTGVTKAGDTQADQGVTRLGDAGVTKTGDKSVARSGDTIKKKTLKTPRLTAGKGEHQQLVKWFCDQYERVTGIRYDFQGGKDGQAVKRLVEKYAFDELKAMTAAMFDDTWGRDNASPAILWSQRNKWRQKALPAGDSQAAKAERQRLAELQEIVHG